MDDDDDDDDDDDGMDDDDDDDDDDDVCVCVTNARSTRTHKGLLFHFDWSSCATRKR